MTRRPHHERGYRGAHDDWLTPLAMIEALGPFDLDPCAAVVTEGDPEGLTLTRYWPTAGQMLALPLDGLDHRWHGLVWLNPPYSQMRRWVARLAEHGSGIALVPVRSDTQWWRDLIWGSASAVRFLTGRVPFRSASGHREHHAPFASALVAYGPEAEDRLYRPIPHYDGALVVAWDRITAEEALL